MFKTLKEKFHYGSSVSTNIVAPMIILTIMSAILIAFIIIQENRSYDLMVDEKKAEYANHISTLSDEIEHSVKGVSELIASHPIVKNGLLIGKQYEVLNNITLFTGHSGINLINVYDLDGIAFARAQAPSHFGDRDGFSELVGHLVSEHVAGESAAIDVGITEYENRYYYIAATVIDAVSGPVGVAVVGVELSESYLSDLLPEWHAGMMLTRGDSVLVSTVDEPRSDKYEAILISTASNALGEQAYNLHLLIEDVLFSSYWRLPFGIILIAGVAGLGSVIFTLFVLYRKVINPVKHLTDTAERQVSGDLSERIRLDSDDELGRLGQILNQLTGDLRQTLDRQQNIIQEKDSAFRMAKRSQERLEEVIRSIPNPIAISRASDDRLVLANLAFCEFLDIPYDQYHELDINELFDLEGTYSDDEKQGVLISTKGNDHSFALRYTRSIEYDSERAVLNAFIDISDRINYENKIKNMNVELEQRVEERTKELVAAKEEAEAANLSKSRFLASASHDLRQPVNAMSLFVSSLTQNPNRSSLKDDIQNMDSCISTLRDMFDKILDISRLETGAIEPQIEAYPVERLFTQIEQAFGTLAEQKGITLKFVKSSLVVRSDPILLHRIVSNLVCNAIQHAKAGRILIGCKRCGNGEAKIIIMDSGVGISNEDIDNIFEEYYRAKNRELVIEDKGMGVGLGLGLSIAEHTAKLLNHRLELKSQVNKYTRCSITVPCETAGQVPLEVAGGVDEPFDATDGLSVFVVDDNVLSLNGTRSILESWGCVVETAASYEEACNLIGDASFNPDVVIADYLLDRNTGLDLVHKINEWHGCVGPCIVLSGVISKVLEDKVNESGNILLYKPVSSATLRFTIDIIVKNATSRAPAHFYKN